MNVAQIFNLSVTVQIVAVGDDFAERGSVSRSTFGCDRTAGFVKTLGGSQSFCGSQTRAPSVAASPAIKRRPHLATS